MQGGDTTINKVQLHFSVSAVYFLSHGISSLPSSFGPKEAPVVAWLHKALYSYEQVLLL